MSETSGNNGSQASQWPRESPSWAESCKHRDATDTKHTLCVTKAKDGPTTACPTAQKVLAHQPKAARPERLEPLTRNQANNLMPERSEACLIASEQPGQPCRVQSITGTSDQLHHVGEV